MRKVPLSLFLFLGLACAGCESELPRRGPDLGTRVFRGLQGEGSLYVPGEPRSVQPSGFAD